MCGVFIDGGYLDKVCLLAGLRVDLQKLVAKGLMTQEEYLQARDVILSRSDARFEPAKGFPVLAPSDQNKPPKTK